MNIADDLSIQLYSLREYGDLEAQLAALSGIGFRRVELVSSHLEDAKGTRAKLDAHGITAPTGHVSLEMLRDRLDWAAEQASIIGIKELYMPAVPVAERNASADGWRRVGQELGAMAEKMAAHGLPLGYHNHDWEMKTFEDGKTGLDHLFDGADGTPLTFEADLAWLTRGGADPVAWMKKMRSRLTAVHVKDLAVPGTNPEEEGWSNVGAGTLDWPNLWREAVALGAEWMILEHDRPKDPVAFAAESRAFLLKQLA